MILCWLNPAPFSFHNYVSYIEDADILLCFPNCQSRVYEKLDGRIDKTITTIAHYGAIKIITKALR